MDAEQQKVTVSGSVDSGTLIKKLVRAGKHAEVWSQKSNQNQKQSNCIKDERNNNNKGQKQGSSKGFSKGLEAFKNQQKIPTFSYEDDDDYMDDYDEEDEEDELQFLKQGHLGLLRQQVLEANNANKVAGNINPASSNPNKLNTHLVNGNAGKKGNSNQNMGMKVNPGMLDQKTLAALKMNNAQLGGLNINAAAEGKRGNDISPMMGLSSFHGNGANGAALGGNPNAVGGFQGQSNTGLQGSSAASFPNGAYATGPYPSSMVTNMNGYSYPTSMMNMMNPQNRHAMQQQPQMMYHRSPLIPPSTGYYYNYNPPLYSFPEVSNYNADHSAATHMFTDENTGSICSIM
ncbi:hypothetical protein DITRI_Ditri17bG0086700 [Diplodiscus trichospermus]